MRTIRDFPSVYLIHILRAILGFPPRYLLRSAFRTRLHERIPHHSRLEGPRIATVFPRVDPPLLEPALQAVRPLAQHAGEHDRRQKNTPDAEGTGRLRVHSVTSAFIPTPPVSGGRKAGSALRAAARK